MYAFLTQTFCKYVFLREKCAQNPKNPQNADQKSQTVTHTRSLLASQSKGTLMDNVTVFKMGI